MMRFKLNGHSDKRAQLIQGANAASAHLNTLCERRKQFALAASDGDASAIDAISAIDKDADKLLAEQATLAQAIEQVERQRQEAAADAEQQDRLAREKEARQVADATLKVTLEIDATMGDLRKRFETRANLLGQLGRTDCFPPHLLQRYAQKAGPTSAVKANGLDKFIAIEFVGNAHVQTLAEASGALRGDLKAIERPPQPTKPIEASRELPVAG
jgi:hypothetical protein